MRRTTSIAIIISIFLFSSSLVFAGKKRAGEAVVKVKSNEQIVTIAEALQAVIADSIPTNRTFLLTFSKSRSVDEVVAELNSNADVELASINTSIDISEVFQISQGFPDESVPIFNKGISPQDYYAQESTYDIGIDSAQLLSTGQGVVIAVIDNGIDYLHPLMLNSNILEGHDFITISSDASEQPGTIYGHGTFVTGLLLLTAPDVSIIPLRAFDGDGIGDQFNVAQAIDWAVRHGADIINMSFGTIDMISALSEAIDDANSKNVVMIAATGNEGTAIPSYPAAHPDVIAVSAVDMSEQLAGFSNYGSYVDIVAPGVNIYSSLAGDYDWGTWSGTSFSAPIVSGTVAMMKQLNQKYTPEDIQNHLRNTSREELLWGTVMVPDEKYGYGMINSLDAVVQLSIGDINTDGVRDITDLSKMIDFISQGGNEGKSVKVKSRNGFVVTDEMVDLNCDGNANMADVAIMVHHLFIKWREFKPCYKSGDDSK